MSNTRWGYSKKKEAIWFYKGTSNSRSLCWAKNAEELALHFRYCEMTNLEYLEGLDKLKEINHA
jgi:hypothetical protein